MRARKWKIVSANRPKTERVIAADGRNQIWRQFIASDFLGLNLATIIFLRYFVFCLSQGSFTFVPEFVFNLHCFTKFFCGANKPYSNISKEVLRSKHAQCEKKFRLIA